jgi:hypothetical protein
MRQKQTMIVAALLVACIFPCAAKGAESGERTGWRASEPPPRPGPIVPPSPEDVERAIRRGRDFLLKTQNKNGAWGSVRVNRPGEVYAPVPGAHHAFRAATTALCVSALIELNDASPEVAAALDRGESWLLANLPRLRRATPDAIYNTWGHAYGIAALARMASRRPDDRQWREEIQRQLRQQLDLLQRYECVDGGWCYYDFNAHTQRPSGSTISFVTAAVLVALHDAKPSGLDPPERLIQRAMESMRRQRKPDFSYLYGEYLKYRPMRLINRPAGSLGRSQACNLAMRLWGDVAITDEVLQTWLDRLFARNLWLDIGRKRPIPHEAYFQVAGYFFYFGHYYAARCIEQLPQPSRRGYQDYLADILVRLQEADGSWWDFPLYDYHQQYGTAFALMSLVRCRADAKPTR